MDDTTAQALLDELRALRAEVAELKTKPAPVARPARAVDANGDTVAVSSGHRLSDAALASRYEAEFLTPMRAAGINPNKRPDLANTFANVPKD